jgi:hypothetical protein
MARKSIVELIAQANATLADNTTGDITAADVRNMVLDFLNAIAPAYGVLSIPTGTLTQTVGLTPVLMDFNTAQDSNPAQTTSNATSNTIARAERGTSTINFTTDFEAAVNRFVTFTLYKNGTPTPWRVTGNGGGTGNPIGVAMTAVDYADPAATYDIRITAEVAGVSVVTSNAALIVQVEPVTSYT